MKSIICGAGDVGYSIADKLSNENFIANAPEEIVNRENNKKIDLKDELEKINSNIKMLS